MAFNMRKEPNTPMGNERMTTSGSTISVYTSQSTNIIVDVVGYYSDLLSSASPTACRDGWLAIGANTPEHVARLLDLLGVAPQQAQALLEPAARAGSSFARALDPAAFRDLLATRLAGQSAVEMEQRLNAAGVPAARVRTLREFTREAVDTGLLQPVVLGEGDTRAVTPGLGWRVGR